MQEDTQPEPPPDLDVPIVGQSDRALCKLHLNYVCILGHGPVEQVRGGVKRQTRYDD